MTKLIDPDREPWEIVTKKGDPDHPMRNDGRKLNLAENNLLITIANFDQDRSSYYVDGRSVHRKAKLWDAWIYATLDENRLKELQAARFLIGSNTYLNAGASRDFLNYLSSNRDKSFQSIPELPEYFDFRDLYFSEQVDFSQFTFPVKADFSRCHFDQGVNFDNAKFAEELILDGSYLGEDTSLGKLTCMAKLSAREAIFDCSLGGEQVKVSSSDFSKSKFLKPLTLKKQFAQNGVSFQECDFKESVKFDKNNSYHASQNFVKARFQSNVEAHGFSFDPSFSFVDTEFLGNTNFSAATMPSPELFSPKKFEDETIFVEARFPKGLKLIDCVVDADVDFSSAKFDGNVLFDNSEFCKDRKVDFSRSTFAKQFKAHESSFKGRTIFASTVFNDETRFHRSKFEVKVPEFYGTDFYSDVAFSRDHLDWPEIVGSEDEIISQKNAYNELRLLMGNLKKVEEEQFFHRQEMRCEKSMATELLVKLPYRVFDQLSDYGWSIKAPLYWLLGIWLTGWFLIFNFFRYANLQQGYWSEFFFSMNLSLASTLPAFGARRELLAKLGEMVTKDGKSEFPLIQYNFVSFVTMLQTALGIFFLFLLLLAIRNRFRLR